MRKAKRDRQDAARKPKTPKLTQAEKHARRKARKNGPSGQRRAERRKHLQPRNIAKRDAEIATAVAHVAESRVEIIER